MPIQKWQLAPEFKADGGFEPETYMEYFEDSDPPTNTEIGCKMPFLDGHKDYSSMIEFSTIMVVSLWPEIPGRISQGLPL